DHERNRVERYHSHVAELFDCLRELRHVSRRIKRPFALAGAYAFNEGHIVTGAASGDEARQESILDAVLAAPIDGASLFAGLSVRGFAAPRAAGHEIEHAELQAIGP